MELSTNTSGNTEIKVSKLTVTTTYTIHVIEKNGESLDKQFSG